MDAMQQLPDATTSIISSTTSWSALAGSLNQLALVPFLAFLYTLHACAREGAAPRSLPWAFAGYLLFIAVAIPAGAWSQRALGQRLANVDALHGACEALLTAANLAVVLSLRGAIRGAEQKKAVQQLGQEQEAAGDRAAGGSMLMSDGGGQGGRDGAPPHGGPPPGAARAVNECSGWRQRGGGGGGGGERAARPLRYHPAHAGISSRGLARRLQQSSRVLHDARQLQLRTLAALA